MPRQTATSLSSRINKLNRWTEAPGVFQTPLPPPISPGTGLLTKAHSTGIMTCLSCRGGFAPLPGCPASLIFPLAPGRIKPGVKTSPRRGDTPGWLDLFPPQVPSTDFPTWYGTLAGGTSTPGRSLWPDPRRHCLNAPYLILTSSGK